MFDGFSLPKIEAEVLEFWKTNAVFEESLKLRKGRKPFKFYEGPPYANGRPGIHHVLARIFKDIILRYKTMRGFYVPRKAGWDTHGLPIEIETEKQLGVKTKKEIEKFGIALFNQKAKESVWQYKDEWEKMTERIGYWLDLKNAYITYENYYIESLWWIFKEIEKRGYLKKAYKVAPYCPRCETPLASHELGMPGAYQTVPDPSVYIKLKIKNYPKGKKAGKNEYLLVWTTTPWTLPANVAVAVDPKLTYTKFKVAGEYLWAYAMPLAIVNGKEIDAEVAEKMSGQKLIGTTYEPLYKTQNAEYKTQNYWKVYPAGFVSTEEGTGLVHIAPAYGEDDMNLMKTVDRDFSWDKVPMTIHDDGKMSAGFPGAGKFVKEADKDIIKDLVQRGLMYMHGKIEHEYPFCWRCGTPLLYFARRSWFIEMSKLRNELVKANKSIGWIPEHLKDGRFGEWIREAKDWAISRERYWGTPLPIWECSSCEHRFVAGGLEDLEKNAYFQNRFWLMRHAEADHNLNNLYASASGHEKNGYISKLTSKGTEDAKRTAAKLKDRHIDVIFTSPFKRTRETAAIMAKTIGAKVMVDERLGEVNVGIFNWRPLKEYRKYFGSPLEEFTKTPPEGENLSDVKKRGLSFLQDINQKYRNKNILVVGHGDPLWLMEGVALGLGNEDILKLKQFGYLDVGGFKEIKPKNLPSNIWGELDLHRPFVDKIYLACAKCGSKMIRVKEVADVWFDSGAMPFASVHYPFENKRKIDGKGDKAIAFPADYICEAIDQTRGWFYTLLAVSVLLDRGTPFKNVISLGLILDKYGQKMSKSKGNVVNPWDVIEKYGVDAIRWYFYTVNPPGEPKRFDEAEVQKTLRRFLMIFYNSYVFYKTYSAKTTSNQRPATSFKNVLDKWILARLNQTIEKTTANLEKYNIGEAAKTIEEFIDDLSRWYIRRSRRRFQKPASQADYKEASATLAHVLRESAKLVAPFTPFFAEALYLGLDSKKSSVHLEDWPFQEARNKEQGTRNKRRKNGADRDLLEDMKWVRKTATFALAKRAEAGIKVRQPLQRLKLKTQNSELKINEELLEILKEEINVKEVVFDVKLNGEMELDIVITPELKEEGLLRELTRMVQELRQKASYKPKDKIALYLDTGKYDAVFEKHKKTIIREVGAKSVDFKKTDKFDSEALTKLEDAEVWIGAKKI